MSKVYTTVQGDTWDIIAFKCYQDEYLMTTLIEANPAYREVVVFSAGVSLTVPKVARPSSKNLPPWRRGDTK